MAAKLLLVLCLGALYAQYYVSKTGGLYESVFELVAASKLPSSNATFRTAYTGIESVDRILSYLIKYRWPLSDGSDPALTPIAISYFGAISAIWTLLLLEGYRNGNKGRAISFPTLFATLGQLLPFAFTTCLYCALHLWNSATAHSATRQDLKVPRAVLTSLPAITLAGFIASTVTILAPISADYKQGLLAACTAWPGFALVLLFVVDLGLLQGATEDAAPGYADTTATATALKDSRYARLLRIVYGITFLAAAIAYFAGSIIPLASFALPEAFPFRVTVLDYAVGLLGSSSSATPGTSATNALYWSLASDYILSSLGVLIWAWALSRSTNLNSPTEIWKLVLLAIFAGPVAAAVWMFWEREWAILGFNRSSHLSVSFDGDVKVNGRPRGGSGMRIGKWERGGKVLVLP
ncbi:hypothetical protein BDV06DRAFT_225648 [Aspergillus oleicola]